MVTNSYTMSKRILNRIISMRRKHNSKYAKTDTQHLLDIPPLCPICEEEIREGDRVISNFRHNIFHESCMENSRF